MLVGYVWLRLKQVIFLAPLGDNSIWLYCADGKIQLKKKKNEEKNKEKYMLETFSVCQLPKKYQSGIFVFYDLTVSRDFTLFCQTLKPDHYLHCLLPHDRNAAVCIWLRPRGHDFSLPLCKHELFKSTLLIDVYIILHDFNSLNAFVVYN
jgi:hypothetical protein